MLILFTHQNDSTKTCLKIARGIHLPRVTQRVSDRMEIWSECNHHSLNCGPRISIKPKGRGFSFGIDKTKTPSQALFI